MPKIFSTGFFLQKEITSPSKNIGRREAIQRLRLKKMLLFEK